MKTRIQSLETEMKEVKDEVKELSDKVEKVEEKVIETNMVIENEIRVNIRRVAEGHVDLSRKLNESIRLSSNIRDRQEIQDIFINMHNSKLEALCS